MIAGLVPGMVAAVLAGTPSAMAAGAAGTGAAAELELPSGALEAATGDAAAGIVAGATAVVDNPARMGVEGDVAGATAAHTRWPAEVTDSSVALFVSREGVGAFGVRLRMIEGESTGRTEAADGSYGGETGVVVSRLVQTAVGYAPDLGAIAGGLPLDLRVGVGGEVVNRTLADQTSSSGAGYAGLNAEMGAGLEVFAFARHLGRMAGSPLPVTAGGGVMGRRPGLATAGDRLTIAAHGGWRRGGGAWAGAGLEYGLAWTLFEASARVGYRLEENEVAGVFPTSGIAFRVAGVEVSAGFVPLGDLGIAQVLSVGYRPPVE